MLRRTLALLLISLCLIPSFSTGIDISNNTNFSTDNGLSRNTVFDIVQSRDGMLWIATNGGLNRFDGYEVRIFRHDMQSAASIASDNVTDLATDFSGRIWAATDRGLSAYDDRTGAFNNYSCRETAVSAVVPLDSRHLLVNAGGRLVNFNLTDHQFRRIGVCLNHLPAVTALYRHGRDIFIGTRRSVYRYDVRGNRLTRLPLPALEGSSQCLFLQGGTRLWVGTEGGGLYGLDLRSRRTVRFTPANSALSSPYVRALNADVHGNLWVGTVDGLYAVAPLGRLEPLARKGANGAGATLSVRCIFRDSQNGIWTGTFFNGIYYYNDHRGRFTSIRNVPNQNSLSNNVVSCIVGDRDRNLWIGTNNGLDRRDAHGVFHVYNTSGGMPGNDIKSVYCDAADGRVYVGTQLGGLAVLDSSSGSIAVHRSHDNIADNNSIYAILPTKEPGRLLLGTLNGLRAYDKATGAITPVSIQRRGHQPRLIWSMVYNRGLLWTGCEDGLAAYAPGPGNSLRQVSIDRLQPRLVYGHINALYNSRDGSLWVCTQEGLFNIDTRNRSLTHRLTTHDGLPSDVVYGIIEDRGGTLWISTDYGLCAYTPGKPGTGDNRNPTNGRIHLYGKSDGIRNVQFMAGAAWAAPDGQILFGGTNGVTAFYPGRFVTNRYTPKPVITGLTVMDKAVSPTPGDILRTSIETAREIFIPHGSSTLSLHFTVPNYVSGGSNTFAYKLEGYDNAWHYTDSYLTASYDQLPHGDYRFLLKAANNDGVWGSDVTTLTVHVLPAWYQTVPARLLFIVLLIAAGYAAFRYAVARKTRKLRHEQERREQERLNEVNEMKQRFFIDISHELRTPLTLIASPLEEIGSRVTDRWTRDKLAIIQTNVRRLLQLVNQLLDYRRAEMGAYKLKVRPVALESLVGSIVSRYTGAAVRHHIALTTDVRAGDGHVLCDPDYLELILGNLLSNALKYTPDGKAITVSAAVAGGRLTVTVADQGIGIPKEKQQYVFMRFYQVKGGHMGSGIGLSIVQKLVELHHGTIALTSRVGEGSTFTVTLPATESAYGKDEVEHDAEVIADTGGQKPQEADPDLCTEPLREDGARPDDEATPGDGNSDGNSNSNSYNEGNNDSGNEGNGTTADTILVVDDNGDIRHYICDALSGRYHVVEAVNGQEALDKMDGGISLVITDVMMPVMDGLQLCRHLKRNIQTSHIPVIILSAKVDVQEQLEGLQVGADDYIPKPFSIAILTAKIRNIFHTRDLTIQHYNHTVEVEPEKLANNSLDKELLTKAVQIVEKHMADSEFTTEMFAREMLMSRSNLHLKIKAITGGGANDFIKHIRFAKACELLRKGTLTVSEISYEVGFSSPSYFSTSFKKKFGCLPSEYVSSHPQ